MTAGTSRCHLSSFLCLSEDYQVAVQAGTALAPVQAPAPIPRGARRAARRHPWWTDPERGRQRAQ